jgi:hypothetical protein
MIDRPFEEPRGGPDVMGFARSVVINRWIRGREPLLNLFSQLITWSSFSLGYL